MEFLLFFVWMVRKRIVPGTRTPSPGPVDSPEPSREVIVRSNLFSNVMRSANEFAYQRAWMIVQNRENPTLMYARMFMEIDQAIYRVETRRIAR